MALTIGVLSTANIARGALIPGVRTTDHEVLAIASRDGDRAERVAAEHDVPRAYDSYEALLADEDLDAVYNPLPNSLHAEWTKRAADRGLHVLCEKPLAADAAEAREVVDHCEDRGVTLMEAFMYRYHPRTERAAELADRLGEVRSVTATFHFPVEDPGDVRLQESLAGGSLMDVGCYAVSAARLFLGEPERVLASSHDSGGYGVDTQLAGVLEYADGATARVSGGFDTGDYQHYRVEGTEGWLAAENPFVPRGEDGPVLRYGVDGRTATETFDPVDQYGLEVEAFGRAVESGAPLRTDGAEAVRNMAVIDALYESADRGEAVAVTAGTDT